MPVLSGTSSPNLLDRRRLTDMQKAIGMSAALEIISDFQGVLQARLHEFEKFKNASDTVRFRILHDLSNAAETLGLIELAYASDRLARIIRCDPQSSNNARFTDDVGAAGVRAIHAIEDYLRHAA
jgi:hypothetical protein